MRAELLEIYYNGEKQAFNKNRFRFAWSYDRKGKLMNLEQSVLSRKDFKINLVYSAKTDVTVIKGKDGGRVNEKKIGLVLLIIKTKQGEIEYEY